MIEVAIKSDGVLRESRSLIPVTPKEVASAWKRYYFPASSEVVLSVEEMKSVSQSWQINTSPAHPYGEGLLRFPQISGSSIYHIIEVFKPFKYVVRIPYSVTWSNSHPIPKLQVKVRISNEKSIGSVTITPEFKFDAYDSSQDNRKATRVFERLPPNGFLQGEISYTYFPPAMTQGVNWGSINEIDPRLKRRSLQVLPFWRGIEKIQDSIDRVPVENGLFSQCLDVFSLVSNFVMPEELQNRKGVSKLLLNAKPSLGDCDEYTDLMVAILRKLGTPARRITGIAYPKTFHAWAEVLTPALNWIPLDAAMRNFGLRSVNTIPMITENTRSSLDIVEVKAFQANKAKIRPQVADPIVQIESTEPL